MTRDKVLEWLDAAGEPRGPIEYEMIRKELLRAAAELIRQSGWRPIAEAPEKLNWALCGRWNGQIWEEIEGHPKRCAELDWKYYFVVPAPPAREVPNERG